MLKAKIAVLVSGGGTNLQALIDAQKDGILKSGEISLVVSSKAEAFALNRAESSGIPSEAICRECYPSQGEFEDAIQKILSSYGIDLVILAGFMSILSASFVTVWEKRIINVHPSLIPSFCGEGYYGLRVHKAALDKGVKLTGATVHYVNHIPDGGEIILQKAVQVYKSDTPETLQKRVMERAEWKILPRAAELVSRRILTEKNSYGK